MMLVVALASTGLALFVNREHLLRRLEQASVDTRYQIRGAEPQLIRGLVVVGIDDPTIAEFASRGMHSQWPFPRRYDARVVDQLHRAGAKVIAVDVQFTEPTDPGDDNSLIEAIKHAGGVVLSTTQVGAGGATDVLGGDAVLGSVRAVAAETSLYPDSDGTIRDTQYSILGLRTFGVAAAEAATRRTVRASLFGGVSAQVPIDYAGPPGTVPAISFARVYDGRFPRGEFAGKIVIVGATDSTLGDNHPTPMSSTEMSGPELLANMTATVLAGIPLRYPGAWLTPAAVVVLALIVCLAGARLGTIEVALLGVGLLIAWSVATQLTFDSGTLLDYTAPIASLLLATGGTMAVGLLAERQERNRLRMQFAAGASGLVERVLDTSGPPPLEPTAIIAGYRLETVVGRGGMGIVYRATQLALDRPVAIKLIAADRAQDPVFRTRFKVESRLAAAIEHVNVIPVYEAGEDDGLLFIAMRLVDGTDLRRVLARAGRLQPSRAALLIGQLADALDAAHDRGLVHRDVKPANVLLTSGTQEHVYLTDFGLARYVGIAGGMTVEGQILGTLDYLAPEQISGAEVGAGADIYALTGVLHHCLTGQVPFPRDSDVSRLWAHVNAPPPAPSALVPGLPAAIDDVIARGMAKDPHARFATAGVLARACAQALGLAMPDPPPLTAEETTGAAPPATAPTIIAQ